KLTTYDDAVVGDLPPAWSRHARGPGRGPLSTGWGRRCPGCAARRTLLCGCAPRTAADLHGERILGERSPRSRHSVGPCCCLRVHRWCVCVPSAASSRCLRRVREPLWLRPSCRDPAWRGRPADRGRTAAALWTF